MKRHVILRAIILLQLLSLATHGSEHPAGFVVQWGANITGQAESDPSQYSTGIVKIAGSVLSNVVAITADSHGLALRNDGTVVGWGGNQFAQAVGFESPFPYRTNGQVILAGQVLSNVTAIAASSGFSLALKRDGTVVAWGNNQSGQTSVPAGLSDVTAIAAGWDRSFAVKKNGTVIAWGKPGDRPARVPAGLSNVVAIAAAGPSSGRDLALRRDGTVVEWISRGIEEGVVDGLSNVIAVASGDAHALALRRDGTVFGWGANNVGQATGVSTYEPPYFSRGSVAISGQVLSNVVAIAAAGQYSLGLKQDGTVVAWGDSLWRTTKVPSGLGNVVAIAAGNGFCLAITTNAAVAARFAPSK